MTSVARALLALCSSVLLLALASTAPAQVGPSITLNPSSGAFGDQVTVSGTGFPPSVEVILFVDKIGNLQFGSATVDQAGEFQLTVVWPRPEPGPATVIGCARYTPSLPQPCGLLAEAAFRVVAPTTTTLPEPSTTTTTTTTEEGPPPTAQVGTTTSSLGLSVVTTSPTPDPPAPSGPTGVAFTTTSTSLAVPTGFAPNLPAWTPDLEITAVEVTQGIQDLQNRMPLIAHRVSLVRVHVAADRSDDTGIGGLTGTTPGQVLGAEGLPDVDGLLLLERAGSRLFVYPDNGPITAYRDGGDRTKFHDALNFTLPEGWIEGEVTMTAFVWTEHPHFSLFADPDPGNNFAEGSVVFQETTHPQVIMLRLDPVSTPPLSLSGYAQAVFVASKSYRRYHPIDVPNFVVLTPTLGPGPSTYDEDPTDEWDLEASGGQALRRMRWLFLEWGLGETDRLHGLIPESTPTGKWSGLTHSSDTVAWSKPRELTPGHEAGHQYGLKHAPCKDDDNNGQPDEIKGGAVDQTHPSGLPSCSIAPEDEAGYFGADLWLLVSPAIYSNDPAHPSVRYPFMGYKSSRATDAYHYCRLMETYGVYCNPAAIGLPPRAKLGPPVNCGPGPGLDLDLCLVIETDDDWDHLGPEGSVALAVPTGPIPEWVLVEVDLAEATLMHAKVVKDSPTVQHELAHVVQQAKDGDRGNRVALRVTSADGHVLALVPVFSRDEGSDAEELPQATGTVEAVPWPQGAASLDLLVDGEVVDSRTPSAAPVVALLDAAAVGRVVELAWAGDDPDGDDLLYSLHWSTDGGTTWRIVDSGISLTQAIIDADLFALPGGEVTIKVEASDGLTTGSMVTGPLDVADGGPSGLIVAPESVPQHLPEKITFHANDPEDGRIEVGVWGSSLDGELGSARALDTRHLSIGTHEISVDVVDSDSNGTTLTASVEVVASDLPAPRLPGDIPEAEAILALGPSGLDSYQPEAGESLDPPAEPVSSGTPLALYITIGAVLLAAAGGIWRILRARAGRA